MVRRGGVFVVPLLLWANVASAECVAVDFLDLSLGSAASEDPKRASISLAYPEISFTPDGSMLRLRGGEWIEFGEDRPVSAAERLNDARVAEQFQDIYPITFDLESRHSPYFDPGRVRNDRFFQTIYGQNELSVRNTLVPVTAQRFPARFLVTAQQNVACQLAAVIETLEAAEQDYTPIFTDIGGSFNWRVISGTNRLSVHSFGIAVDVNAEFGQYWKWTGAREGNVGAYYNRLPAEVVQAFEKYGFIWGGKWHHFDGMHFEFRPELIIYARLVADKTD